MRHVMRRWLGAAAIALLLPGACWAAEGLPCPKLPDDGYPALVYVVGVDRANTLCVAYLEEGEVHREVIVSGSPDQIRRLDAAVFLAHDGFGAQARPYAIDIAKGRMKPVEQGDLLRSVPERGKAMLARLDAKAGTLDLIEVDLKTLESKLAQTLTKEKLGDEFDGLRLSTMKLSPDFARLAYARLKGDPDRVHSPATYSIKVLDLSTLKVSEIDDDVQVRIGMFSSRTYGRPPFEWLSDDEILYQHAPDDGDGVTAEHVLRIADVKAGTTREIMRPMVRMTVDGGRLDRDPVSGRIEYNREYLLDLKDKALVARDHPFSVERGTDPPIVTVRREDAVVFEGDGWLAGSCLSPSGKHFAVLIRPDIHQPQSILYAIIAGRREPVVVSENASRSAFFLAWVEKPDAPPAADAAAD